MLFGDEVWDINKVVRMIHRSHDEFLTFLSSKLHLDSGTRLVARWISPPIGCLKLNIDGSFLGTSNRMGSGGIFRDDNGCWVTGFSSYDGPWPSSC